MYVPETDMFVDNNGNPTSKHSSSMARMAIRILLLTAFLLFWLSVNPT